MAEVLPACRGFQPEGAKMVSMLQIAGQLADRTRLLMRFNRFLPMPIA
jgi:hypothetical protein